jgi:hypothetical protein
METKDCPTSVIRNPSPSVVARLFWKWALSRQFGRRYEDLAPRGSGNRAARRAIQLVRKLQWNPVVLAEGGTPNGKVFVMLDKSTPVNEFGTLFLVL